MYTNKAPGGVAYRCSFRVTEAMFFQERMVQAAADDLGMDQAEFRRINFVRDDDFPHRTPFGFLTDSGQYGKCLDVGLEAIGYQDFLRQKEEAKAATGRLLGIGISTMTEPLGAGNSREYDILGIKMFDSAELRVHMTGKAILRTGAKTQGQGHETTWAQIVAHELGIPAEDIVVEEGDTDTAPFGMGTYASRSTPVAARRWRWCPARSGPRPASSPPTCSRCPRRTSSGSSAASTCAARRTGRHHPGVRDGGVQQHARRHGARPREQRLLRPAEPHLAVRLLHRDRRGRPRDRGVGRAQRRRGRRLRRADQPDDGSIADFNRATSKLTVYMTTQAPHIIRAAVALVAELPEHMIRIVSPDLGGGFGNKVPVYPGYVMSILASILLERPVKWIEDRTGNLISTGFARDIYLHGEMALRRTARSSASGCTPTPTTARSSPTPSRASSRSA